jgi:hypothetical protein
MSDGSNVVGQVKGGTNPAAGDRASALFAGLVLNHTQMALLLLGRTPHPATGEAMRDLDGARMLIDQLDMLEQKTRGNLESHETQMLRESLTALRMAFVEASNASSSPAPQPAADAPKPQPAPAPEVTPGGTTGEASGDETRKKFTKKY